MEAGCSFLVKEYYGRIYSLPYKYDNICIYFGSEQAFKYPPFVIEALLTSLFFMIPRPPSDSCLQT